MPLLVGCHPITAGLTTAPASAWALDATDQAQGPPLLRIVPTRPLLEPPAPQSTWVEFRQRAGGIRLMILSTEEKDRCLKSCSGEETLFVVSEEMAPRKYRANRLAGGQTWIGSHAMTLYVMEQLQQGHTVMLYRTPDHPWITLSPAGFQKTWEALQKQVRRV